MNQLLIIIAAIGIISGYLFGAAVGAFVMLFAAIAAVGLFGVPLKINVSLTSNQEQERRPARPPESVASKSAQGEHSTDISQ